MDTLKKKQAAQAESRDQYRFEASQCHTFLKFAAKIRAEGQNMKITLKKSPHLPLAGRPGCNRQTRVRP